MQFSIEILEKNYQNKWVVSTKRVVIESDERLEGELHEGNGAGGVVICHPHPLYGGSMWSNVVDAVEDGFAQCGFTTLRFNFRGVGGSTGSYDEGNGEGRDVAAACRFLKENAGIRDNLVLAGYSFGAWACSRALGEIGSGWTLFFVAYPFSVYPVDVLRALTGRIYLVGGSADDISPLDDLMRLYGELKAEKYLKVIPSTHFFNGKEDEISTFIIEHFSRSKVSTGAPESP
jgi:alpha/beta superfamily hydrolase